MQKISYPITVGVPSVAVIGVSGAGKSSLLSKVIALEVSSNLGIVGTEQAQTTLIPTEYFLRSGLAPQFLRLRATCRIFGEGVPQLDCEAVFTALTHPLLAYVDGSQKSQGVQISVLKEYIGSGSFPEDFLRTVNGAVRLEQLDSPVLQDRAAACALELLDTLDCSAVDAATAGISSDKDKRRARRVALRDALQQCWDNHLKDSDSSVSRLLSYIGEATWSKLMALIPSKMWHKQSVSIGLDMSEESDRQLLKELLSPKSPLSLIVEKYEIYCAMHKNFQDFFEHNEKNPWIDPKLPFRLILCDTAGLTQDVEADASSIQQRLSAAVTKGCTGILLMMPNSIPDHRLRTILQCFRARKAELGKNNISTYLAIARADEALSFTVDLEEDEDTFRKDSYKKWGELKNLKRGLQSDFEAVDARYITNRPKRLKAYIDDIKAIAPELGQEVERCISLEASYSYLYDITKDCQKSLLPKGSQIPIFVKLAKPVTGECLVQLHVFDAEHVMAAAQKLAEVSAEKYYILNRLHGNTVHAFWKHHTEYGDKFVSRAEQYGRIYVHIDGDVRKALGLISIDPLQDPDRQVDLGEIILDSGDSETTLFERLGLPNGASKEAVKRGLWQLFMDNFGEKTSAGFARVVTQAVRWISYKNKEVDVKNCYNNGCMTDLNQGVVDVLAFYRRYFSSKEIAADIAETLNDQFSKAFSQFFFALYSNQ